MSWIRILAKSIFAALFDGGTTVPCRETVTSRTHYERAMSRPSELPSRVI